VKRRKNPTDGLRDGAELLLRAAHGQGDDLLVYVFDLSVIVFGAVYRLLMSLLSLVLVSGRGLL
jgi:hypothetical protein